MTFDPTTNRIPWGLLTEEEREVLEGWPWGWEGSPPNVPHWLDIGSPKFMPEVVYRGKPDPERVETWVDAGPIYANTWNDKQSAINYAQDDSLALFRLTYNEDGSDPQVEVVK